ncbi:17381_t:CDS:2 [Rhizophagus irregularis]|nr:17381_t:CDS:2 [Rhizophagus irregularis]
MTVNDTAVNLSELDLLRQRNAELKAELEAEREEKRISAFSFMEEIDKLKKKNADLFTENFDLKEQELKNMELENRLVKVEQSSSVDEQPRDQSNNASSSAENEQGSPVDACSAFLIEEHKKGISEEIRQRNREKKLQRESAGQDSSSSELSHETEIIEGIANSAVDSNTISDRSASEKIGKTVSQGYDQSASENLEEIGKTVSLGYDQVASESLEEIESKADYQDKSVVGPSIVTEFVQGLLEELLSSDNQLLKDVKFSSPKTIISGSISIKRLANSFCQANGARNRSITTKRSEITTWRLFSERFENKVLEPRAENKKLADRTAKTQIYSEMKPYLTDISDEYLCLFGFEYDPVTLKKIDGIPGYMNRSKKTTTSPVNEISESVAVTSAYDSNSDDCLAGITEEVTGVRIYDELTHKEVARLEALEAIKSQPNIDFVLDDEKMDDKPEDINIFDDIDFDLDEEIMDDKPVDSNYPINARTEGVLTGIIWSNTCGIS